MQECYISVSCFSNSTIVIQIIFRLITASFLHLLETVQYLIVFSDIMFQKYVKTTICRVHFIFSILHQVQVIKQYLVYPLPFPCFFISIFPYISYFPFLIYGPRKEGIKSISGFAKFFYCVILKIYSKTEMSPRLVSVPLAISYNLDFLLISKVWNVFTSRVSGTSSE